LWCVFNVDGKKKVMKKQRKGSRQKRLFVARSGVLIFNVWLAEIMGGYGFSFGPFISDDSPA
jgi:hypothetical protein